MLVMIALVLCSYLAGSISFALIIGKTFKGVDIRNYGSGNLGATNAIRVLGPLLGVSVLILDALKGFLCVFLIEVYVGDIYLAIACGIAAVFGHCFPIYLKFRGGKGVATGTGVLIALLPWVSLYAFLIWLLVLFITRYVSLASLVCALFVTFFVYFSPDVPILYLWAVIPGTCFIFFRHRKNIQRIINGTEAKASWFKKKEVKPN